jgi:hypothetical protein
LPFARALEVTEALGDLDFYLDSCAVDYTDLYKLYKYLQQIEGIKSLYVSFYHLKPNDNVPYMDDQYVYSMK